MMKRTTVAGLLCATLTVALAGCQAKKSLEPAQPLCGRTHPGRHHHPAEAPRAGQGFKYKESQQPIKLVIENARPTACASSVTCSRWPPTPTSRARCLRAPGSRRGRRRTSVQIDRSKWDALTTGAPVPRTARNRACFDRAVRSAAEAGAERPGPRLPIHNTSAWPRGAHADREKRGPQRRGLELEL